MERGNRRGWNDYAPPDVMRLEVVIIEVGRVFNSLKWGSFTPIPFVPLEIYNTSPRNKQTISRELEKKSYRFLGRGICEDLDWMEGGKSKKEEKEWLVFSLQQSA